MTEPSETAYYYPEPYWLVSDGSWVKTLLLFFDEVAILLPDYMVGRHRDADPSLVEPLKGKGLLRILHPEWFVDAELTERMTESVVDLISGGAFDNLPSEEPFAELSMSRMGYGAVEGLASMVYEELERRGLARPTEDGVSIPMHWRISRCTCCCWHNSHERRDIGTDLIFIPRPIPRAQGTSSTPFSI